MESLPDIFHYSFLPFFPDVTLRQDAFRAERSGVTVTEIFSAHWLSDIGAHRPAPLSVVCLVARSKQVPLCPLSISIVKASQHICVPLVLCKPWPCHPELIGISGDHPGSSATSTMALGYAWASPRGLHPCSQLYTL